MEQKIIHDVEDYLTDLEDNEIPYEELTDIFDDGSIPEFKDYGLIICSGMAVLVDPHKDMVFYKLDNDLRKGQWCVDNDYCPVMFAPIRLDLMAAAYSWYANHLKECSNMLKRLLDSEKFQTK